jgi:two-component system, NtrC family, nitrogen regulation sensor histidine kinase NtrY
MPNAPNHSPASLQVAERGRKRATKIIIIASVVLLLMLSLIAQGGFNLRPFLSPETAGETLLLYALSTLNFFAFITLLFVLLRNIIKLERERRAGIAGSRFKARLVF